MTSTKLAWQTLQPQTEPFASLFSHPAEEAIGCFDKVQTRLANGLLTFSRSISEHAMMLVKSTGYTHCLPLLRSQLTLLNGDDGAQLAGGHYTIAGNKISWREVQSADDNFACHTGQVAIADWIESEQLFGCARIFQESLTLEPGLIHRINGGTLIISLWTVLTQPLMWRRLKQIFLSQHYIWLSPDVTCSLPVTIPSMPLRFRLLLAGERDALAEFQQMEPEFAALAIYSEFEADLRITSNERMSDWCLWVRATATDLGLGPLLPDLWPVLIKEGARYTGYQQMLPLCPCWIGRQLQDAALFSKDGNLSGKNLTDALTARAWQEGFLIERMQDEILQEQIMIETEGEAVGQINGLSVTEFPGHPRAFGEPCRISCVIHPGDGEFNDVERKVELGGNIHAKGMMIMQAWLIAELEHGHQLPFSASLVFEQSYSEVDGDSASLAGLCALISALSGEPINQQIAVTGSIDQFGNIQPIGGLNEKIEGFFAICQQRGFSGQQGVILPASNLLHLVLQDDVINAVREDKFHLWSVSSVEEALPLLMKGKVWYTAQGDCLLRSIKERITHMNQQDGRHYCWPLRWLNWFSHH